MSGDNVTTPEADRNSLIKLAEHISGGWAKDARITEQTARAIVALVADYDAIKIDRDEADRAAGSAIRQLEQKCRDFSTLTAWRDRQKESRGFHHNVSFDRVWEDVCSKADRLIVVENALSTATGALKTIETSTHGEISAIVENTLSEISRLLSE